MRGTSFSSLAVSVASWFSAHNQVCVCVYAARKHTQKKRLSWAKNKKNWRKEYRSGSQSERWSKLKYFYRKITDLFLRAPFFSSGERRMEKRNVNRYVVTEHSEHVSIKYLRSLNVAYRCSVAAATSRTRSKLNSFRVPRASHSAVTRKIKNLIYSQREWSEIRKFEGKFISRRSLDRRIINSFFLRFFTSTTDSFAHSFSHTFVARLIQTSGVSCSKLWWFMVRWVCRKSDEIFIFISVWSRSKRPTVLAGCEHWATDLYHSVSVLHALRPVSTITITLDAARQIEWTANTAMRLLLFLLIVGFVCPVVPSFRLPPATIAAADAAQVVFRLRMCMRSLALFIFFFIRAVCSHWQRINFPLTSNFRKWLFLTVKQSRSY